MCTPITTRSVVMKTKSIGEKRARDMLESCGYTRLCGGVYVLNTRYKDVIDGVRCALRQYASGAVRRFSVYPPRFAYWFLGIYPDRATINVIGCLLKSVSETHTDTTKRRYVFNVNNLTCRNPRNAAKLKHALQKLLSV